ncbi:MAG TPA: putative hydro-lyase [Actinophytocola sp.]|uniref:putative hydro-lyase n=1 Tax=Actinophytocola sp. TaxID=1872138 RepID=UPI002DDD4ABF|nr:putative hydro-lyase [Actinophytocola sp.]HEV2777900.1 putative hydro-lyase [Actinophytocola sp.]
MSTPAEARAAFRSGVVATTSGWADGYVQANLVSVPREHAYDMLLFAQRNPKPCPVLDVTDAGSATTVLAPDADLRTDLPRYRVWRHGVLDEEPTEVSHVWRADLVTFLIGCSFTFEAALAESGVPLRHVENGTAVPMYVTNRKCRPAGRFGGPMVVSMRPVPAGQVATAVAVTARVPAVHGAPVHVGAPAALGIADLARPDFGDPIEIADGDVCVFWACGVTPQAALIESKIPFAITHAPAHMFITDVRDIEYRT